MKGLDDREIVGIQFSPVCTFCDRLKGFRRCEAFGEKEIPLEIWEGRNDHTAPFKGDNGLRFERAE